MSCELLHCKDNIKTYAIRKYLFNKALFDFQGGGDGVSSNFGDLPKCPIVMYVT